MIQLVKVNNNYDILLDNKKIGYINLISNPFNMIDMFIDKVYRGNGYGSNSFKLLLNELKNASINNLIITFQVDNIPMMRIINHYKSIIKNKNDKLITYEIINV